MTTNNNIKPTSSTVYPSTTRNDHERIDQLQYENMGKGNADPADPENETDFKKAYLKLVKKVYQEQGANILISQYELDKVAEKDQFRQEDF